MRRPVDSAQFHSLALLADGTLLDAFVEAHSFGERLPIKARVAVARSEDRGLTWDHPVSIARVPYTVVQDPTGRDAIRASGLTIGFVAGLDGAAYVSWAQERPGGVSTISTARSTDGGLTWRAPRVAVSSAHQLFFPALALSGDGRLGLTWYELLATARGATELPVQVRFAFSDDAGLTWRPSSLAGPFDLHTARLTRQGDFLGDYEGLAGLRDGFGAAYAVAKPLSRRGPTDIFFSRVQLPTLPGV